MSETEFVITADKHSKMTGVSVLVGCLFLNVLFFIIGTSWQFVLTIFFTLAALYAYMPVWNEKYTVTETEIVYTANLRKTVAVPLRDVIRIMEKKEGSNTVYLLYRKTQEKPALRIYMQYTNADRFQQLVMERKWPVEQIKKKRG